MRVTLRDSTARLLAPEDVPEDVHVLYALRPPVSNMRSQGIHISISHKFASSFSV